MKPWKVILATLVIFTAGLVTGAVLIKSTQLRPAPPFRGTEVLQGPHFIQKWFLARMEKELALTSEQTKRLDKVFADSRERIRILWSMLEPEMQAELADVHVKIMAELNPDQEKKFEELRRKSRPGRVAGPANDDHRPRSRGPNQPAAPRRDSTVAPASPSAPTAR